MRQAILIVGAIVLLGFLVFGMRGGDEGVPVESDQAVTGTVDDSMDKAGAEADAAAESAGRTLEQAADDAAAAGREAMDKAGEAADDAMAAISDAAGKAADTVKGAADAVGETAKDAMASAEGAMDNAGATAGDAMHSASETGAEVARMTTSNCTSSSRSRVSTMTRPWPISSSPTLALPPRRRRSRRWPR
ncbi:hypothetical protein CLG85_006110 [Yangia mangrovi]|uniref:Late embryogenesis abundant protein n=1 Tax=Alloyangia mangrovi TaxID=1779329 RepID=A0ABT2KHU5_9RHOB|nr:hypothetical protein [Alloyangia mangrovi]MCT4369930.1 hypothetical protein [Alloyangia mangrovi]